MAKWTDIAVPWNAETAHPGWDLRTVKIQIGTQIHRLLIKSTHLLPGLMEAQVLYVLEKGKWTQTWEIFSFYGLGNFIG